MTSARTSKLRAAILFRRRARWRESRGFVTIFASSSTESSDEAVITTPVPLSNYLGSLYSETVPRSMFGARPQEPWLEAEVHAPITFAP